LNTLLSLPSNVLVTNAKIKSISKFLPCNDTTRKDLQIPKIINTHALPENSCKLRTVGFKGFGIDRGKDESTEPSALSLDSIA